MSYDLYQQSEWSGEPQMLYRFTMQGTSQTWLYANTAKAIIRGSEQYVPNAISHSAIEQNVTEGPQAIEVTLPATDALADKFRPFLPASPITVTIYARHRPDAEFVAIFIGECEAAQFDDEGNATISCQPFGYKLRRNVPWPRFCATCNWAVFSLGCGLSRDLYRVDGSVLDVNGVFLTIPAAASKADGWFTIGFLVRESTGEVRWITGHVGEAITIVSPFPGLQPGEALTMYPGCDGAESTCESKYDNKDAFAGFPDVPTKNPFRDNLNGTGNAAAGGGGATDRAAAVSNVLF